MSEVRATGKSMGVLAEDMEGLLDGDGMSVASDKDSPVGAERQQIELDGGDEMTAHI